MGRKGQIAWNKGLTKETDERVKRYAKNGNKGWFLKGDSSHNKGKHCSEETKQKLRDAKLGSHHSEETKQKIREGNLGKVISEETKQKMSKSIKEALNDSDVREKLRKGRLGKKHSEETKDKLSKLNSGKTGELSPAWKGGISFEPYCQKFNNDLKERVREYFDRKCYVCDKTEEKNGRKLDVHHVNYNKMMCCNDVKPLFVPLCRRHNAIANFNRESWEEFFTVSLEYLTNGECFLPKGV